MGIYITEDQVKQFNKQFLPGITSDLGRNVLLHIPGGKQKCFNCTYDPIGHKSTGMYSPQKNVLIPPGLSLKSFTGGICPVCNGSGQIQSETTKIVKCLIRWLKTGNTRYVIQGIEAENDVRLKTDIKYKQDFLNARVVEVDGIPFQVNLVIPAGLRDLVQIRIFLKRNDWPQGKKDVDKY